MVGVGPVVPVMRVVPAATTLRPPLRPPVVKSRSIGRTRRTPPGADQSDFEASQVVRPVPRVPPGLPGGGPVGDLRGPTAPAGSAGPVRDSRNIGLTPYRGWVYVENRRFREIPTLNSPFPDFRQNRVQSGRSERPEGGQNDENGAVKGQKGELSRPSPSS